MRKKFLIPVFGAVVGLAILFTALGYDSEWPPAPDPIDASIPPGPGLQMGKVSISIPWEFGQWFNHQNNIGWGTNPLWAALGDVEGADNGGLDIVIVMPDEIVFAARVNINWSNSTGWLTPLWCWKVPNAPSSPGQDMGVGARNCLIWDFDGDGKNEVAVVAPKQMGGGTWGRAIYILQTDPSPPPPPWDFSVPPPKILASSPAATEDNVGEISDRLGVCKVRDTAYPMDIVSHEHDGESISIWKLSDNGGSYSLDREYSIPWRPPVTHEYNYVDVDGDGFDEFFWDGVLDFVDRVGGVATPTNPGEPLRGVWKWNPGHEGYKHSDQMICADYDPSHPGLEINAAPEEPYTDPDGIPRLGVDTLWTVDGHVLRENANCPFSHPQSISSGNWSSSRPGLETIHVPKSFSNPTVRGGETWLAGHYAVDAQQNELAVDGAYWVAKKLNGSLPIQRASGPAYNMRQIDWDGDYSSDEILNWYWRNLAIWRMGEKGDWLPGPPPAGMPDATQVTQSWQEEGYTLWWEFYQGYNGGKVQEWGVDMINQYGGPGRWSHYYEKLGEAWPGHGLWYVTNFDVGRDYREEAVVVTPLHVNIFYNLAPLANPNLHPSPRESKDYLKWQMDMINYPFMYADLPTNATELRVTNQSGETLAEWDDAGNLTVKGSLTENSTPRGTSGGDFLIKGGGGAVVAVLASTGDLVLAGSLYENQGSVTPTPGSFVIKNSTGEVVGCITSSGDMYLKGTVTTGS